MSIEISGEIEARLTDEARRLGITVEQLLARLVSEQATKADLAVAKAELPAWDLGTVGALHRRDIYRDGR
jgi:hypothetical protein